MMKSILLRMKPIEVVDILNGIEINKPIKNIPNNYIGDVYVYVSKANWHHAWCNKEYKYYLTGNQNLAYDSLNKKYILLCSNNVVHLNGKIAFKFYYSFKNHPMISQIEIFKKIPFFSIPPVKYKYIDVIKDKYNIFIIPNN